MSSTLERAAHGEVAEPNPRAVNPALRGPILLATDGTSESGGTVMAARALAERLGVPLEVVSVLEPQLIYGVGLGGVPVYFPEIDDTREARQRDAVLEWVARYSGGAAPPRVHVRFGAIAEEIALAAAERSATVVVVGAAPHQRLNRMIGGERAVHVLRSSTVPVWSVAPGTLALPRRAVVAIDFSPASVRAAETALLLLGDGGTLTLLHVLPPSLGDAVVRAGPSHDPAAAVQVLFERLLEELRPHVPDGVTVETRVRTDAAVDGIVAEAVATGADLIAVGTHGPRLIERVIVGSVASSVLHTASQAVLAVPPPRAAEALRLWLGLTGTAASSEPSAWAEALDEFSRRNRGRRVAVEVDDPEIGAQMLGRGTLVGVTYDPRDRRVEIMMGDPENGRRHLMHSIPKVESIAMTADERGANEVLELRHGRGQTLVVATR